MRAREFMVEAESVSTYNLINTLENLRSTTDQIRVDSLVNLVRKKPGSEMFNVDLLVDAYKENPGVKNMIRDIKDDESGVKYVFLKALDGSDQPDVPDTGDSVDSGVNPEKTVATMAKRAIGRRD